MLKREVMDAFRAEADRGRTIVLTTQILSEAEELCDDILIMQSGRQVARGDLHALKLLSDGVYEVALTFDKMPPAIDAEIEKLRPIRRAINHNTLELAVKASEADVLEWLAGLARRERILHVELSGASLKIFSSRSRRKGADMQAIAAVLYREARIRATNVTFLGILSTRFSTCSFSESASTMDWPLHSH